MQIIKVKDWTEVPKDYTGITEYPNGTKKWYLNGELHREDGPAVEWADGSKVWFLNGENHREDGPAVEYTDGDKWWYLNGKFLFRLLPKSQPFVFLEEFMNKEGEEQIKVLIQTGIETWPILPGLKELADNWENPSSNTIAT